MLNTKITIDRTVLVTISEEFTNSNGNVEPSPFEKNVLSSEIESFLVSELELVDCPDVNISGTEFATHINSLNLVPLDEFCAQAILEHKNLAAIIFELLKRGNFFVRKDFDLKSISFFGSFATNGEDHDFIYCLQFSKGIKNKPVLMVFENDPDWQQGKDLALVLNKKASEKLRTNLERENTKRK